MTSRRRHLLSIADLPTDALYHLVARGVDYAKGTIDPTNRLAHHVVGVYFRRTSTRTRTAFSSGALRLGAQIVAYGPNDLQENTGEAVEDTTRVLSGMLDGFVARTAGPQAEMRSFASQSRMAVVNAMSEEEHPTQALADLTTLVRLFGDVQGLRVLYVGEGNNTAWALALAMARYPNAEFHLRTPPGYGFTTAQLEEATAVACRSGARFVARSDMAELPGEVDVVYATRWQTTGTSKADPNWRNDFMPFQVNRQLMSRYPGAVFLHDLPAHRGEDVEAEVLDGQQSKAFLQAEHKLYSAMAVLEWCLLDN